MSLQKIHNQPYVIKALLSGLKKNKLPHAFLFSGPKDAGQETVALELAKTIFCKERSGLESCDVCLSCAQVPKGVHPDYYVVNAEEGSQVIKVEQIREMMSRASLRPMVSDYKVFVINEAEKMTETVQNAFLKTLEEPGRDTVFILISYANERLLPTLRSRTQNLNFIPIQVQGGDSTQVETTAGIFFDFMVSRLADERSGTERLGALEMAPPEFGKMERTDILKVFDGVIWRFRDALFLRVDAKIPAQGTAEDFTIQNAAKALNHEQIMDVIELLSDTKTKIAGMVSPKLALSVLWDEMDAINPMEIS